MIAAELAARPRATAEATAPGGGTYHRLVQEIAKLRRDNHHLAEHLKLAIANNSASLSRTTSYVTHLRQPAT